MFESEESPDSRIGRRMIWLASLGLLGGLFALFSMLEQDAGTVISVDAGGAAMIVLEQDRNGHYQVQGEINNQPVTFMIDTGATDVIIPKHIAQRLKLKQGVASQASTANGLITVYATRLKSVSLGAIILHDIKASINPHVEYDEILLGMSFMKHLELAQRGKELTLKYSLSE